MKYKVYIREKVTAIVEVDAEDMSEAKKKAVAVYATDGHGVKIIAHDIKPEILFD